MNNILFTGGDGHLCSKFKNLDREDFIFLNKLELDITKCDSIDNVFRNHEFKYVVHSAAITRPMIEHDINPIKSIETNIIGTANIVKKCIEYDKKLIYISTDYVYGGGVGNYSETSPLLPPNNYGWSKLGGECSVQMISHFLILRIAMVEYPFPHETAFNDVYKSSIWSDEIPELILSLKDESGIYNIGGVGQTIYDFVKKRYPKINSTNSSKDIPKNVSISVEKINKKIFGYSE